METLSGTLVTCLVLVNFFLLSSSRLKACVKVVAAQGVIVSMVPILTTQHEVGARMVVFALCIAGVKAFLLPSLLFKSLRDSGIRNEVEPYISYSASVLFGLAGLMFSFFLSERLPFPAGLKVSPVAVPVAISTVLTGLFIIITRKKAFSQVLGYLVFENGIYFAGAATLVSHSFVVEMGILLDVLVLVFILGIAVFHISNEFDHIDTNRMRDLSDAPEED